MIFQEPMSSLNPCFTVGFQIMEALKDAPRHGQGARASARAIELLGLVGIPVARAAADGLSRTSCRAA